MDMMMRRRAMMGKSAGSDWDYEWDYTMGLPTSYGWTRTGSTLGTNTKFALQDEYLQMYVYSNAQNQHLIAPRSDNIVGVFEVVVGVSSLSNYQLSYLIFGNSDSYPLVLRFQYSRNYKGIYFIKSSEAGSGWANWPKLLTFNSTNRSEYNKIRLESDGTYGRIYINDVLKATAELETITTPENLNLDTTQVYLSSVSSGNSKSEIHLKSLKLKLGRV